MILSVSRRTDIPCHYAAWFMNRIRAGYALIRNPMNHAQLSHIPLSPDVVDGIVFWTKDAAPLLPYLAELDRRGYAYYFQFTLTPYGADIEPGLRPKPAIEETFITLSRRLGKERVVWRYDPILLTDTLDIAYHRAAFARLSEKLAPYTDTVTISFVDIYAKCQTQRFQPPTSAGMAALASFLGDTAKACGLRAVACCEAGDFSVYGIDKASCIDKKRLETVSGYPLDIAPDRHQRPGCGCAQNVDIGAYNTCPSGCVYCYATQSAATAKRHFLAHDPCGELLTGSVGDEEKIAFRVRKSNRRKPT